MFINLESIINVYHQWIEALIQAYHNQALLEC